MTEPTVEYKVTITRITREMKTNRTSYERTGKKDENGDDNWEYVPAPDKMENRTDTVLEVRVPTIDLSKVFEAVSND